MSFALQPVRVATGVADEDGCLVFENGRLVAVLVRLSDEHENLSGKWFLEHGFGRLDGPTHPTFENIDAAQDWLETRLSHRERRARSAPQR